MIKVKSIIHTGCNAPQHLLILAFCSQFDICVNMTRLKNN